MQKKGDGLNAKMDFLRVWVGGVLVGVVRRVDKKDRSICRGGGVFVEGWLFIDCSGRGDGNKGLKGSLGGRILSKNAVQR